MGGSEKRDRLVAQWREQLDREGRVEVPLGKRRLVLLSLMSTLFVLVGLALAVGGDGLGERAAGWAAVVFFGAGVVLFARQLVRTGPAVVVDHQGITTRDGLEVPWSATRGAFVFAAHGTQLVQVAVDPAFHARWQESRNTAQRAADRANTRLTGGVESLSLPSPLAVDASALAAWLTVESQSRNPSTPGR